MNPIWPVVIGLVMLGGTIHTLYTGSASADGEGILRKEEPLFYWFFVLAGFAGSGFLFYLAWRNGHGG